MTIVAEMGGWHIESHRVDHGSIAAGAQSIITQQMDKPGRLIWLTTCFVSNGNEEVREGSLRKSPSGEPLFGDEIAALQCIVRNSGVGPNIAIQWVTVAMRD